jgi:hypothetical protein
MPFASSLTLYKLGRVGTLKVLKTLLKDVSLRQAFFLQLGSGLMGVFGLRTVCLRTNQALNFAVICMALADILVPAKIKKA